MLHRLVVLAFILAAGPPAALAHDGPHKKMGTVTIVGADHVTMKTTDGKDVIIGVNAKTRILKGKTPAKLTDLKEGTRIVATVSSDKAPFTATRIAVGVTMEPPAKR